MEGARRPPRPPSETTSLALAEALRRLSSQGWTCGSDDGEAAMLSRWRLREQMLDGVTRGGGRATQSVVVATEDNDDGWDLPPPPVQRRWMRRCRCPFRPTTETTKTRARDNATQREGGGATTRDKRQVTTACQGVTLQSSRHCGDVRGLVMYDFEWEFGRSQIT